MGRTVMLKVGLKSTREQKVRVKTTARARDRVSQSLYDVRGRVPWRLYSRVFGTGAARSLMGESGGARAVLAPVLTSTSTPPHVASSTASQRASS